MDSFFLLFRVFDDRVTASSPFLRLVGLYVRLLCLVWAVSSSFFLLSFLAASIVSFSASEPTQWNRNV